MKLLALFRKSLIENVRDWKILIMTLVFAPLFVLLMYFYVGGTVQAYTIIYIDNDLGATLADGSPFSAGDCLIANLSEARYADGTPILRVSRETDREAAYRRLIDQSADLVVELPANFTTSLLNARDVPGASPAFLKWSCNPSNSRYLMAGIYNDMAAYQYAVALTDAREPLQVQQDFVGPSGTATTAESPRPFDLMVPGLLALAAMMLMFTTAASFIREKDKGTIIRLKMSRMRTSEFIASIGLVQVIIGTAAIGLTYLTALALGFKPHGSLLVVLLISVLACLSIIVISILVAAFLRSIFDLLTIGCIPFFILMFFSGGMFPLPSVQVFTLGGHAVYVNDVLPTTHAIAALGKVLNYGAGPGDLWFEIVALLLLTGIYFVVGLVLFRRRYLATR